MLDEPNDWSSESLPIDTIIDMWEMAHVKNPANLMEDLGINDRDINLSRLLGVIDEELQNVHNDREFTPLLRVRDFQFLHTFTHYYPHFSNRQPNLFHPIEIHFCSQTGIVGAS